MINGICEWKCFNYCENGGVCSIALKEPYCNCNNTGYHGQSIEQISISCLNLRNKKMFLGGRCEIRDCSRPETCEHGECQLDSTCKCFEGWSGDRCEFNICDMVQCPEVGFRNAA